MTPAPFRADLAEAPPGARTVWMTGRDGVRLRLMVCSDGARATVLIFPGRTECAEKYGRVARDLWAAGLSSITIDWRGQGLSDRLLDDPLVGHVAQFSDYQTDVRAMLQAAEIARLPKPYFLLAHSMGGAIGLRALIQGLGVRAAAFSAPMWGLPIAGPLLPAARAMGWAAVKLGKGGDHAPNTYHGCYLCDEPFAGNVLTSDPDGYAYMKRQVVEEPDLALGGPSYGWVYEAIKECDALAQAPRPTLPTLVGLGSHEKVVNPAAIHLMAATWPSARVQIVPGAEHELLVETEKRRSAFMDGMLGLFDSVL